MIGEKCLSLHIAFTIFRYNILQQPVKKDEELTCKKEPKEEGEVVSDDKKKDKKLRKEKKESRRAKKNKQPVGPMHFTANNEPRALDVLGDLDPSIFNEVSLLSNIPILIIIT